jgi:hypothetical protein
LTSASRVSAEAVGERRVTRRLDEREAWLEGVEIDE